MDPSFVTSVCQSPLGGLELLPTVCKSALLIKIYKSFKNGILGVNSEHAYSNLEACRLSDIISVVRNWESRSTARKPKHQIVNSKLDLLLLFWSPKKKSCLIYSYIFPLSIFILNVFILTLQNLLIYPYFWLWCRRKRDREVCDIASPFKPTYPQSLTVSETKFQRSGTDGWERSRQLLKNDGFWANNRECSSFST